jgi:hypothetical protein
VPPGLGCAHQFGRSVTDIGDPYLRNLAGANSTTYAITIELPPDDVWPWLVQIGRGRGGFYTYTSIERFLGADIANLDRIDPSLQTLGPGDRIWMTPERYLGRLPGQFGWCARSSQGEHSSWNGNPRRIPSVPSGHWCCSHQWMA